MHGDWGDFQSFFKSASRLAAFGEVGGQPA